MHVADRLRILLSRWAIPGWLLVAWKVISSLSTAEFVRASLAVIWPRLSQLLNDSNGWLLPALGILWLNFLVLRKPRETTQKGLLSVGQLESQRDNYRDRLTATQSDLNHCREEVVRVQDELRTKSAQIGGELETTKTELISAHSALRQSEQEGRERFDRLWAQLNYKVKEDELPSLTKTFDFRGVSEETRKLTVTLDRMMEAADAIMQALLREMEASGDPRERMLAQFLKTDVVQPLLCVYHVLQNALQTDFGDRDPREPLIVLYLNYHRMRRWMIRLGEIPGVHLGPSSDWIMADQRFHDRLAEALRSVYFKDIARRIEEINAREHFPHPLLS